MDEISASKMLSYGGIDNFDALDIVHRGYTAYRDLAATKASLYGMWLGPSSDACHAARRVEARARGWIEMQALQRAVASEAMVQLHVDLDLSPWTPVRPASPSPCPCPCPCPYAHAHAHAHAQPHAHAPCPTPMQPPTRC
eukprot:2564425-Prymnesium_polylepis.1